MEGSLLVFDRSEHPAKPMRMHARQETTSSLPASIRPSSTSAASPSATATSAVNGIDSASTASQSSLPTPFDSSMGNNFTAPSCPAFFQRFLTDETFKQCLPLSMLLQTSNGFFAAERSIVRLTQTLDATCNVDFNTCSTLMGSLAQQIQQNTNCGQDLQMENPTVVQAYNGLLAYQPLYQAGCLTSSDGNYCFVDAVTNTSAPTSSYIYYLPLGVQLPAGTQPACNMCLQRTMSIFATAASNSTVPLSDDYTSAAQQVDMGCGPQFVEASVEMKSAATLSSPGSLGLYLVVALVAGVLV